MEKVEELMGHLIKEVRMLLRHLNGDKPKVSW